MHHPHAAPPVRDIHVDARTHRESAAQLERVGVEAVDAQQLSAGAVGEGLRIIEAKIHACVGVARLFHVLVGELEALGIGRVEDELSCGEGDLEAGDHAEDLVLVEVLPDA